MYRPKFCCECGERVLRENWKLWTSRRYCETCAKRLQKKQLIAPILVGVILLSGGLSAGRFIQPAQPPLIEKSSLVTLTSTPEKSQSANGKQQSNTDTQTNASTASAQTPVEPQQPAYLCGARTQKGSPCMRRVRNPARCWQHEGKQAMMPQEKLLIKEN